jgi:hypothetical protein
MKWFGEPSPAMGGIKGQGIATLLRTNRLDDLSVLVRETIQNSWDARLADTTTVEVSFSGWTVSSKQLAAIKGVIDLDGVPQELKAVRASLAKAKLPVVLIRDKNCQGLGGPVRGDLVNASRGSKNRYASFLLNVGGAEHNAGDGGAFGYGRSIAYRVSKPLLIIVYTRTAHELKKAESRIVASMLSDHFENSGVTYTGRHWWGDTRSNWCSPVTGDAADEMADQVGIERYGPEERGTSILIVDPTFGDDLVESMKFIADIIPWNVWPKMVANSRGHKPMSFDVSLNGKAIQICDPEKTYPIKEFCAAYRDVQLAEDRSRIGRRDALGSIVHLVEVRQPKTEVGLLGLRKFVKPATERAWATLGEVEEELSANPLGESPRHVALMRTPELIVDYLRQKDSPDDKLGWIGVFRANDQVDGYFKDSEPPTHDAWNKSSVEKGIGRTVVSVTFDRLKEFTGQFSDQMAPPVPPASAGVRALAQALSEGFMSSVDVGSSQGGSSGGGSGGSNGKSRKVNIALGNPVIRSDVDGTRIIRLGLSLPPSASTGGLVNLKFVGGIAEGDANEPIEDPSTVMILKLESSKNGRTLWTGGKASSSCEVSVKRSDFPLTVSLRSAISVTVVVDATASIG